MKRRQTETGAEPRRGATTALAWYTREEWDAVRREASDPEVFDATYETWQANATRVIDQLRDQGLSVERVFVRASKLRVWCEQQGIPQDGRARSHYAAEKLRRLHAEKTHGIA